MNAHLPLHPPETGPPAHTEPPNITLLGNLALSGCSHSLLQLKLLAHAGNEAARQELRSISHSFKDTDHAPHASTEQPFEEES